MGFKHGSEGPSPWVAIMVVIMVLLFGSTDGDIKDDKEKCGNQLVGLATCLPYVGGETKAPTKECCSGLKLVLTKSKVCMCILIKDHNDPSLNLKINDTLALSLPDSCHTPTNVSQCVSLLHLQPGSPNAKIFEDYAKAIKNKNTTTKATPAENATSTNDGGSNRRKNKWLRLEIVGLLSLIAMLHLHLLLPNDIGNQSTV